MKIEPTDKVQTAVRPGPVLSAKKPGPDNFASVFEQKVGESKQPLKGAMAPLSSLAPPVREVTGTTHSHIMTASGLVDGIEHYQKMLADPAVNLRDLAAAVEKLTEISVDARKIMKSIAEDEPLKDIMRESLLVISKEIERFNLGVYVEQ